MKTRVATISAGDGVIQAAKEMRKRHVGDLVVTQEHAGGEVPEGILTDRDILLSTVALGVDPTEVRVSDIMSTDAITVIESESLEKAVQLMKERGVQRLPVVNAGGFLVGVVSAQDLFPALLAEALDLSRLSRKRAERESTVRRDFT